MSRLRNLYAGIPDDLPEECFEQLPLQTNQLRIERIVSRGHATPPDEWYDQDDHEYVLLLKGGAGLRFKEEDRVYILKPGDWLEIPAHCQHRVEWTHPEVDTVWLAVHYPPQPEGRR